MDKKKKPSSYNFFKGEKYRKDNSNKGKAKQFWKWTKIFVYIFVFAVTLTGCIQTFAISNSSTVGSAVEYYNSKDEISPNSTTFEQKKYGYEASKSQSSAVNGKTDSDKEIIKKLREISATHGGSYGAYGSFSSLIMLNSDVENKDSRVYETIPTAEGNNKILYFNSTFTSYEKKTVWTDLWIPSTNVGLKDQKDAGPITKNSIYKISSSDLNPAAPLSAIFARDVLQMLYDKTMALEPFKDEKLKTALENVNKLGIEATVSDIELVTEFSKYTHALLAATRFNYRAKDQTFTYNYYDVNPIAFAGPASKPISSWAEAWELGPFFGLVWFPLATMMGQIIYSLPFLAGWESIIAILIAIIVTRLITLAFTFKSIFSQSKQEELQFKKAKIDAKYAPYKGNKQMEQRQRQEISEMYKKNNFSPFSMFGSFIISTPIFLGMWRVVQGIAAIKSTTWLGINFSATSWQELLYQGMWVYLPLLIATILVQIIAQLLPRILAKQKRKRLMNENEIAAMKKQQKTQNIIMLAFIFFYLLWQAGIQIYSIFGGIWTIGQALAIHYYKKTKHFNEKLKPWLFKEKK